MVLQPKKLGLSQAMPAMNALPSGRRKKTGRQSLPRNFVRVKYERPQIISHFLSSCE
jgi:hypothetical protein